MRGPKGRAVVRKHEGRRPEYSGPLSAPVPDLFFTVLTTTGIKNNARPEGTRSGPQGRGPKARVQRTTNVCFPAGIVMRAVYIL